MMSMSGGWFFVVASEAITVGETPIKLPGIGSWLAVAIDAKDIHAVILAGGGMAAVILAYDQLLFRPIVAWANKFRFEQTAAAPASALLGLRSVAPRRGKVVRRVSPAIGWAAALVSKLPLGFTRPVGGAAQARGRPLARSPVAAGRARRRRLRAVAHRAVHARLAQRGRDLVTAIGLGLLTLLRVAVLIALASVIWVPIGVWIGLRPGVATRVQPVARLPSAAFPANVLFPMAVVVIVAGEHLDPDIWLSPLMVLGTQWYILFNVIAGASAFPTDLREASTLFRLRSWQWWRKVIAARHPAVLRHRRAHRVGRLVERQHRGRGRRAGATPSSRPRASAPTSPMPPPPATIARVVLGIVVMSVMVVTCNRLIWRPLYRLAERRFRLD